MLINFYTSSRAHTSVWFQIWCPFEDVKVGMWSRGSQTPAAKKSRPPWSQQAPSLQPPFGRFVAAKKYVCSFLISVNMHKYHRLCVISTKFFKKCINKRNRVSVTDKVVVVKKKGPSMKPWGMPHVSCRLQHSACTEWNVARGCLSDPHINI